MPAQLIAYAAHLGSLDGKADGMKKQVGEHMAQVFNLLRRRTGHDFSGYKISTIGRLLQRRMKALQMETVGEYVEVLEREPEEIDRLFKELLVGVTEFFRDAEAFDALAREVIPELFENKKSDDDVRVCIVGCATGEEVIPSPSCFPSALPSSATRPGFKCSPPTSISAPWTLRAGESTPLVSATMSARRVSIASSSSKTRRTR